MMGSDMDIAKLLMTSTGGFKKSLFMLDTSYEHFHFLPNTTIAFIFCHPCSCHSYLSNWCGMQTDTEKKDSSLPRSIF